MDDDKAVLCAVAEAVAATMSGRGYQPDCTLGTRLAIMSLRALGIPSRPVPTSLAVLDSVATSTLAAGLKPRGNILEIGHGTGEVHADGWDGHLVALAQTETERVLVDTTFGQIAKHRFVAKVAGGANVLVRVPPKRWLSVDRDFSFPLNGGSISYRHEPKIDWTLASGWNHPALKELVSEVLGRARLSRAGGSYADQ